MLKKSKLQTILLAGSATFLAVTLILFPEDSLKASVNGLNTWWKVVFPSLLPFLIIAEIMIGFGVVKFFGVMLEPLMRPLFRVPGAGGFVWAMGMASGFPAGAKLTARLRQEEQLTAIEAERLVSFTNASNPLFLFGVIAVGFFHNPELGLLIAVAHYAGNFFVGLVMRFHGTRREPKREERNAHHPKGLLLKQAFDEMHNMRVKDKRPLGAVLGDAVTSSIQTLVLIGGFIILFSVLNQLLQVVSITTLIAYVLGAFLTVFGLSADFSIPLLTGLFEITIGSQMTSKVQSVSLLSQVVITSFILAFNGFSIQAQVASILATTDIRFTPFFLARILHGCFASILVLLLWKPLYAARTVVGEGDVLQPVFGPVVNPALLERYWHLLLQYGPIITLISLMIYIILLAKNLLNNQAFGK